MAIKVVAFFKTIKIAFLESQNFCSILFLETSKENNHSKLVVNSFKIFSKN